MTAGKEDIIVAIFIVTAAVAGMVTHTLFLIALKESAQKFKLKLKYSGDFKYSDISK